MRMQLFSITTYITLNIAIIVGAFTLGKDRPSGAIEIPKHVEDNSASVSYLSKSIYYILRQKKPYLHLEANELSMNSKTQNIVFFKPSGSVYDKLGRPIRYQGKNGLIKQKEGKIIITGDTKSWFQDSYLEADFLSFDSKSSVLLARDGVKTKSISKEKEESLQVDSDELQSFIESERTIYKGNVRGKVSRKKLYEEKVYFKTNELLLENLKSKLTLLGKVQIKKDNFKASSKKGEIFLKNYNKKLKYYVLYDDVVVNEKVVKEGSFNKGRTYKRQAFAEKLEGFMQDNKIVLTGYPKVYSGTDVIKGNIITLRKDREVIEVDNANTKFKLR